MDNKQAASILKNHIFCMNFGYDKDYSFAQTQQVISAIRYCVDKLERESAYYYNLPKGDDHNEVR